MRVVAKSNHDDLAPLADTTEGASHRIDEVVLEAWARWGAAAVRQFNGMFAFASWDSRDRLVFQSRPVP